MPNRPAKTEREPRTTIPRLAAGIVAGLAATVPMTIAMELMHRALPRREQYPLPPREITENVERLALGGRLPDEPETALTWLSHFGYGAATGGLYGLAAGRTGLAPATDGAAYGLVVWTASYLGWLPAAGLFPPATREPARRVGLMIAAHLVWGATAGVVTDAVRHIRR